MNECTVPVYFEDEYKKLKEESAYQICKMQDEHLIEVERLTKMYDELKTERNRFVIQINEQSGQIKAYEYVIERMFDK